MVAARLAVVIAAAAAMNGLIGAATGGAGAAGGAASGRTVAVKLAVARSAAPPSQAAPGGRVVAHQIHIEGVSAPVLVSASELEQAEHGQQASTAAPAAAPTAATPTPAAPTPAPAASPAPAPAAAPAPAPAPAASHSTSTPSSSAGATGTSGNGTDLGTFMVTCYDIHGQTATGDQAGPQSVAVDPAVIPLGTKIYIDGVGYRTADDTGGSVTGHHIDIWESSYSACADFGRQYRDVHQLS
ncbi:MAG TPA: 3D domain-containing protein [Acidimicrobiales bacterium]|nr:3D domain-containing protein [Acidimicrobiales bacterium]